MSETTISDESRPTIPTEPSSQLLLLTLVEEESEDYWLRAGDPERSAELASLSTKDLALTAFREHWFGQKTESRVEVLVSHLRRRFDAFPPSLSVLARWPAMTPADRRLICHWHLQLADPLYRDITGVWMPGRRAAASPGFTRSELIDVLGQRFSGQWSLLVRQQLASKLITCAAKSGLLVSKNRGLRPFAWPEVSDKALGYVLHLLRGLSIPGSLLENPWLNSVDLAGRTLDDALRRIGGIRLLSQGGVRELAWDFPDLQAWAEANL